MPSKLRHLCGDHNNKLGLLAYIFIFESSSQFSSKSMTHPHVIVMHAVFTINNRNIQSNVFEIKIKNSAQNNAATQ